MPKAALPGDDGQIKRLAKLAAYGRDSQGLALSRTYPEKRESRWKSSSGGIPRSESFLFSCAQKRTVRRNKAHVMS
jgi:hypothetical protein